MGEVLAVLGFLILALVSLGVPIMLIVTLSKISKLQREVSEIKHTVSDVKPVKADDAEAPEFVKTNIAVSGKETSEEYPPVSAEEKSAVPDNKDLMITEAEVYAETAVEEKPFEHKVTTYEPEPPTAIDLFFEKIGNWLAVSGEFAPSGTNREFAFATRWLVRIGTLLLVASIAYFVKLSVDRGWMGPTGRIIATLMWGSAGVAGGVYLVKRTKYAFIGHAVAALGIVALYFGFGLGYRYFDPPVIPSWGFAFTALVCVTVFAGFIAVMLSSSTIAVLGLIGGYLVPIITAKTTETPLWLYLYLLSLNTGTFAVARIKRWSALNFAATMAAFFMCFACSIDGDFADGVNVFISFIFATAIHALYITDVISGVAKRNCAGNALAWSGLVISSCAYLGWLSVFFRDKFKNEWTGLVFLVVAAVYIAAAAATKRCGLTDRKSISIMLVFALAHLALAPLLLFKAVWCVVSWSVIAVVASEAEIRTDEKILGILSRIVLSAAACVGLFYFAPETYGAKGKEIIANGYLTGLILRMIRLWSLPAAAVCVGRRTRGWPYILACVAAFLFFTAEAKYFGDIFMPSLESGAITLAWTFLAIAVFTLGIICRVTTARITALWIFGLSVLKLLIFDTSDMETTARVIVFALVGIILIAGAFLYIRFKERFEENEN